MNESSGPAGDPPIVECAALHKRFGRVDALKGVTFSVATGEFVAITGPSGCGKSTLLHLLAALDRPTSGRVVVNGHDLSRLRSVNRYRRHDIGIVFQLHNLLPHVSAARNVELAMFGSGVSRRDRSERSAELLELLGLSHTVERAPPRLSGGERQRVAIARALVNGPAVLLADEPTGSLDAESSARVLGLFDRERGERGTTILMVSHDPVAIERAGRQITLT